MSKLPRASSLAFGFATIASLFFIWGYATATVDTLIPAVRSIFELSYAEAVATQFAFFIAYAVVALPASTLLARVGYSLSIQVALATMVAGCVGMMLASRGSSYLAVLASLFVVASGVTLLQVTANPLVAQLGRPERSHFRLTLVQAFNSMGAIVGPIVGAQILLQGGVFVSGNAAARTESLYRIEMLFAALALLIVALIGATLFIRRTLDSAYSEATATPAISALAAFRDRWALAGAGAIFLYVGSEVAILSLLVNFLVQPDVLGVSHKTGGQMVGLYAVGRMTGRFIGSYLMTRMEVASLLRATAAIASAMCLAVFVSDGVVAGALAVSIGLFTSITFPAVFTLTLQRSQAPSSATSGLLVMGITGGALLPLLGGQIADMAGLRAAFLMSMTGFLGVSLFAWRAHHWRAQTI